MGPGLMKKTQLQKFHATVPLRPVGSRRINSNSLPGVAYTGEEWPTGSPRIECIKHSPLYNLHRGVITFLPKSRDTNS